MNIPSDWLTVLVAAALSTTAPRHSLAGGPSWLTATADLGVQLERAVSHPGPRRPRPESDIGEEGQLRGAVQSSRVPP